MALSASSILTGIGLVGEAEPLGQPGDVGVDGQTRLGRTQTLRTTLAVLRPTPGRVTRSSSADGTSPSKRSTTPWAMPMRLRVLFW